MPATRHEATRHLKPPKETPFAKLAIGTAIRPSRGRLRTVATVNATSSEQTLNPQTPRVKREPLLRIREKSFSSLILECINTNANTNVIINVNVNVEYACTYLHVCKKLLTSCSGIGCQLFLRIELGQEIQHGDKLVWFGP